MPFLGLPNLVAKPTAGRSEYGRVKVVLPPGKGLMDWIRLASGKILAKKHMSVDQEELMKHNKKDDCWVLIFGQVYDVTSYLEFHPGGIPELMRAAGTDGTDLFNQYHAWVNYESMLKSCLVGRFAGDVAKLPQPGPSTITQQLSVSAQLNALIMKEKQRETEKYGVKIENSSDSVILECDHWANLQLGNVVVDWSSTKKNLRIVVRPLGSPVVEVRWDSIPMEATISGYQILVRDSQVAVHFDGKNLDITNILSSANQSVRQSPLLAYHECSIVDTRFISHDTRLYSLRVPQGIFLPVAVGRHVSFKIKKGSSKVYRSYTPVNFGSLPEGVDCNSASVSIAEPSKMFFAIKIYPQGICTPSLNQLQIGDTIEISEPVGAVNLSIWTNPKTDLLMLAAGTGLTPMINVLSYRLIKMSDQELSLCNTTLLLFNKTENDIINDDWMPVKWSDPRIRVEHILSEPSGNWTGKIGRINADMLPLPNDNLRVLLCGPDGFVENAAKLLHAAGHKTENIHVFQG